MYSLDFKLKVLKHADKHGIDSALDAFGVSSSSFYSWQKKLKRIGEDTVNPLNHSVLQNQSTRPHKVRTRTGKWDYRVERFIQQTRFQHPGLTKEKVWKLLGKYCDQENIKEVPSVSTVGRMIDDLKKNRQIPDWSRRISFYANTGKFRVKPNDRDKRRKRP
jgi:hypothetical protein